MSKATNTPTSHVFTDETGETLVNPVLATPAIGTPGIPVYSVGTSAVQPTEDAADGVIGATAPLIAQQAGATDNTGNLAPLKVDNTGALIVSNAGGPTNGSVSLTSAAVPTMATYMGAESPGGNLLGLQLDVSGNLKVAGTINATNPSVSTTGTAIPASATMIGGSDGTNLKAIKVSTAGVVSTDSSATTQPISAASLPLPTGASIAAKQPALGVAGTPSADVISIQGVTSMTPIKTDSSATTQPVSGTVAVSNSFALDATLTGGSQKTKIVDSAGTNVATVSAAGAVKVDNSGVTQPISGSITANIGTSGSLALDASVTALQVAQASTTSGQKGTLALGAVTTAAPTYTTAQSDPLSLTTAGALRVDASGTTQPVSGTVTVTQATAANLKVDLSGTAANATAIKTDSSATTQPVSGTVAATQSGTWTVQPGNTANTTPWLVQDTPATSGGLGLPFSASLTSTKQQVKGSAGQLYGITALNNGSVICYIQVFDKTSVNVTVGTTAPDYVFPVPAPASGTNGAGLVFWVDKGYVHANGITVACTTTRTGNATATADVIVSFK